MEKEKMAKKKQKRLLTAFIIFIIMVVPTTIIYKDCKSIERDKANKEPSLSDTHIIQILDTTLKIEKQPIEETTNKCSLFFERLKFLGIIYLFIS